MASPKNKPAKRHLKRPILWLVALVFYAALACTAVYIIVFDSGRIQTGELGAGQISTPPGFHRTLDLRVAAKNTYPSGPVTITRDLGDLNGVSEKIFQFKVPDDGLTEYGLMMTPTAKAPKGGYPTIILCHGYESPSRYITTVNYISDMEFYAQRGFAVLKPDFRGQGLSKNQGLPDSAYYSMSYNTDVMSLISAVKKTSYLDKNNLSLWGHSLGAYIALRAAVLSPDIKNLILLSGPVDSLKTMYLTYIPSSDVNNLNALKSRNEVLAKYGNPTENPDFWNSTSPINFVGLIKAYVQIHVGAQDQIVPPKFSADLDAALTKAHINHDYYVYPEGRHSLSPQRYLIWPRSLQILKPATSTPPA